MNLRRCDMTGPAGTLPCPLDYGHWERDTPHMWAPDPDKCSACGTPYADADGGCFLCCDSPEDLA